MKIEDIFKEGVLIDPDALDYLKGLDEEKINTVLTSVREEKPLILTREAINKMLKQLKVETLQMSEVQNKISVQESVTFLNEKFNFLRGILLEKIDIKDAVSIGKAVPGKCTVIGMINKKNDNLTIILEDSTGSIICQIDNDNFSKMVQDDVIAVSGKVSNKTMFAENVLFPEIPYKEVNYTKDDLTVRYIANETFDEFKEQDADVLIITNSDKTENVARFYPNTETIIISNENKIKGKIRYARDPAIFTINNITILITKSNPKEILKKRYITYNHRDFLIKKIPDIIFNPLIGGNYKGITFVMPNKTINLKDRGVN